MNSLATAIGQRIGLRRGSARQTKSSAARATGIPRIKIWRIEAGRQMPDAEDLWRLADHFDCSIDDLIGRSRATGTGAEGNLAGSTQIPDSLRSAMLIVLDARRHGAEPHVSLLGMLKMGLEAVMDRDAAPKLERAAFEREGDIVGYLRWEEAHPPVEKARAND